MFEYCEFVWRMRVVYQNDLELLASLERLLLQFEVRFFFSRESNATGTEKVPITMIGKAKEPACIVGNSWPLPYVAQRNA